MGEVSGVQVEFEVHEDEMMQPGLELRWKDLKDTVDCLYDYRDSFCRSGGGGTAEGGGMVVCGFPER